ncbi:carbohydrate ABC transporter permease [Streptomyces albireticuli]|uniref:ABC transporter permease n=1 Tax=Streptomyces albireticuli TaxID=1940 RepID=A0A2A2D9F4_9ACTN|nr:sugar ABC transporter permease [Streptomyces albireticuli]MCD9140573.1 sugar ABC transporter permease [Streptomyces albireticuli]MCD9161465.1 sugar ABC transporter permease [Streptomyces albireticuli]MCD9192965.1 sugar ABC transporter permease [Streptomyces albireticuli]PAU48066.1 ABC transporter permease [Streptomyces albireticuli]
MQHGKYRFIVGFLAVPLAIYAVFVISPFVQAIYYSFTDWTGLSSDFKVVGFGNYRKMFEDDIFWKSVGHNVLLLLVLPLVTLGLGLFFAFMLNVGGRRRKNAAVAGVRGSGLYKVVYFFPQVLSIAIVALLFQFAYNPNSGALNSFLKAIGLDSVQPDWLGDPQLALWCVMAVMVWSNVGFYVVLFSAGMSSIPRDFYEAALLDGANRVQTFFRITLPLLWDTVQTGWVYMGIMALDGFAVVQIMTVGPGGPDYSTEVLAYFLYTKAFRDGQAGYATTLGVALLIVTMIFAGVVMKLGRRERLEF